LTLGELAVIDHNRICQGCFRIIDSETIENPKDIANSFNNFFTDIGKNINEELKANSQNTENINNIPNTPSIFPNFQIHEVQEEEIGKILKNINIKKSPGPDGIPNFILKLLEPLLRGPLTNIINASINKGTFPTQWKESIIIPVHKGEEKDIVGNYRPIALTNTLSRILEKIMNKQLSTFLEENDIISKNQHGFRPHHSTENLLIDMFNLWLQILDNNTGDKYVVITSIDVRKAFDSVNHDILLKKLKDQFNFGESSLSLIKSFLTNRSIQTKVKDTLSIPLTVNTGVPQGSLTGPNLFIMHTNDLNHIVIETLIKAFADDTIKSANGETPNEAICKMNLNLIPVTDWFTLNLLMINAKKTKSMVLATTDYNKESLNKIKVQNHETSFHDTILHLGITIDRKLSLSNHVESLKKR